MCHSGQLYQTVVHAVYMLTNLDTSQWLGNQDLARRYRVSIDTVRKWRATGAGPKGVRFGRHVRYSLAEIERWEREQIAKGETQHTPAAS